ncbi:MAG: ribonuclease P protein subunit [Desulfurococcaceae archaeon]|uniref:Ribonuclease P protein component 1 n=1 Tax=Staphylothermus marinus TaxID=2280 RepID=A0A7C4DAC9_STAMA
MKHSVKNIFFHELIGLDIELIDYPDTKLVGLKGRIIDETRKTIVVETNGRIVRVFKENSILKITIPSGETVLVRGFELMGRPEDRLKKIVKRG